MSASFSSVTTWDIQTYLLELTPSAQKKAMIGDEDDFIERNIPIEILAQMNEFKNRFSSLSYGVKDENQMTIKL